jgi:hypothetical protein
MLVKPALSVVTLLCNVALGVGNTLGVGVAPLTGVGCRPHGRQGWLPPSLFE